ncbi:plasmid partition protein [Streptomyces sp. NPDC048389]|uniref:plasmid partition protein n=1 Tax=Streptomyces sp. NPDC048389 TaxID=3154622 RepID=UPI003453C668
MLIAHVSPRTMGKTTNAAFLAHAMHERGYPIIGFDADHSRQFQKWDEKANFPFTVLGAATPLFHTKMPAMVPEGHFGMIDCGHAEDHMDVTSSVLRCADIAIVNSSPSTGDLHRIRDLPMRKVIDDVVPLRVDSKPPETWVLLNRVPTQPNANAVPDARKWFAKRKWNVFTTTVPFVQQYSQAMPFPVKAAGTHLDQLVTEMKDRGLLP